MKGKCTVIVTVTSHHFRTCTIHMKPSRRTIDAYIVQQFPSFQIGFSKLHTYRVVQSSMLMMFNNEFWFGKRWKKTQAIDYRSISHLMDLSVSSIPFLATYNLFFLLFFTYYYTRPVHGVQLHDSSFFFLFARFVSLATSIAVAICTLEVSCLIVCLNVYVQNNP